MKNIGMIMMMISTLISASIPNKKYEKNNYSIFEFKLESLIDSIHTDCINKCEIDECFNNCVEV